MPSLTKTGSMSWAGATRVSATMRRIAGVVRSRRGRETGRRPSGSGLKSAMRGSLESGRYRFMIIFLLKQVVDQATRDSTASRTASGVGEEATASAGWPRSSSVFAVGLPSAMSF